tara:strand:- start:371 stop:2548 length:2178 start_codon:yes stop_codon:yes gene_type:complete
MAQNDIIDIDEIIDANINLNQPIPQMNVPPAPQEIIPQAYGPETTPGQFIPNDFKNFLVDKLNIQPQVIDKMFGQPYGVRDRFINANPKDLVRDIMRFQLPGTQPLDPETQQPFGLNINELFSPSSPDIQAAEEAGVNPKEGAPYQVQKDASYLPPDNYERGVKVLLKEAFPNVPLEALEIKKEPRTGRVVYKDPESGEVQFLQPPGIDFADVTALMEPVMLEIGAGVGGFLYGNTAGRVQGGLAGGAAGLATASQMTDNPFFQSLGAVGGAAAGAINPVRPLAFTVMGESLAHFVWRYNNLRGMKERGILDETYTPEKIMSTAISDAKMVGAFSLGGQAAFGTLAKFLGNNPSSILGIDPDGFVKAFEEVENIKKTGSKAQQEAVEDLTTPQVLGMMDESTPIRREAMQKEVDDAVSTYPEIEQRILNQEDKINIGYEKVFADEGINPDILIIPDVTKIKQTFGRDIGGYFDPKNIDKKAGRGVNPTDRKAMANKITGLIEGADPEGVFEIVWREGKVTNTETFLDMMPASKVDDFKTLIYRDFIDSTDGFNPNAIQAYLNKHTDGLKAVYGEEFVDGLRSYNRLIKDISVAASRESIPEDAAIKLATGLARAYLGIFTRPGRVITAGTQVTSKSRKTNFQKMILDPELLYKRIMKGKFLSDPNFYTTARAIARTYEEQSSSVDPESPTSFPTQERIMDVDFEDLQLNRGGSPMIELNYGYGDK